MIWDEADGSLDITFIRLKNSEADLAGFPNVWEPLAEELYRLGLNDPNKIYAVWHPSVREGGDTVICGVQTEYDSVSYAFSFFKRVDRGKNICPNQPVTMVHELSTHSAPPLPAQPIMFPTTSRCGRSMWTTIQMT